MRRWFAVALAFAHGRQRGFEMARESGRVEKRTSVARASKLLAQRLQHGTVAGEFHRQDLILIERFRDQFGKPSGMQQARANTAGKGRSLARQDRKSGP